MQDILQKVKRKMGSSTYDDALQKELAEELVVVGNRLLALPSAIDELLELLEKAEIILFQIWQEPLRHTRLALHPFMKALIKDELLRHTDENVQVAVASCFIELTRISAPKLTYYEDHMKEFFQLCMIALKHLSSESGTNYFRAFNILETLAKVRTCLVLLDIDCDELIVEMFQLFFNTIRSNHPTDIFKYMETIMTLVIQESDEISFEFLKPLLDSIKMDNKNISQISWDLGNIVFKNCSAKLQHNLRETVKTLELDVTVYAEIFASICHEASSVKKPVVVHASLEEKKKRLLGETRKVARDVVSTVTISNLHGLSIADPEDCTPHVKNDDGCTPNRGNISNCENSSETLTFCQRKSDIAKTDVANEEVNAVEILPSEKEARSLRRRGKQPSLRKPEEGYELPWRTRDKDPCGFVNEENPKKKKGRMINQLKNLDSSFELGKMPESLRLCDGEDLVNLRIQVWWPKDKMFYSGTIVSFDPLKKKHKVLYDDGETEILNMDKEIWKSLDDHQDFGQRVADPPAPAEEPIKARRPTAKRKPGPCKKPKASSLSKSSKGEKGTKSRVHVKDEVYDGDES